MELIKRCPPNKILTREDEIKIVKAYNEGLSPERIRVDILNSKFKTAKSISDALKRLGAYERRDPIFYSNTNNHNYFSQILTEKQAYFLGIMQSDGWVHSKGENCKQVGMCLAEQYIVEEFKKEIDSLNKIVLVKKEKEHHKQLYQLLVNSVFLYKDLLKFGVDDKFNNQYMPVLPNNLYNHYIRGLFDGDGTVHSSEKTKNLHIGFLGGLKTMSQISFFLSYTLGIYQIQPNLDNEKVGLYGLRYSEKEDVRKIYDFLYKDATFYMIRKKNVFESWFQE